MKRFQAFVFRIEPNCEQQRHLLRFAGSCRFVWNRALSLQKQHYEAGGKFLRYEEVAKQLPLWKKEEATAWLSLSPSQVLQQTLQDLDRAYQNFFSKRAAYPQFKKKGQTDGFRYPQGFKLEEHNARLFLPKLGWLRYRNSRNILGTPKNVTVSHHCGKWFISIQTEREVQTQGHPSPSSVGIDLGIARFATLSDGTIYEPINSFKKYQRKLARHQRMLSRKKKQSQNYQKCKFKIQTLHEKMANVRKDFLHKTSTSISKNHSMIVLEELKVKQLSKSASGTVENPGKHVRQKSGLNRCILDQSWAEFRRLLEYKQAWRGGLVIKVPAHYTSQRCSLCGHVSAENRKSQACFSCVKCGYTEHADMNAAKNIEAAGHAVLACGEKVQQGLFEKQEPAEVTLVPCT